jgi:DNA-binding transcriptional ArsR family regulator
MIGAVQDEQLQLSDPRAMRALAHPARLTILELLHAEGTTTATECAAEIGGSPQAASYHLRALAKWGLIRRADSEDGRETRWELTAQSITFTTHSDDSPARRQAGRMLGNRVIERDERLLADFIAAEDSLDVEWRNAGQLASVTVYATPDEVAELTRDVREVVDRLKRSDPADRPAGSRRVHVVFRTVPRVQGKSTKRRS